MEADNADLPSRGTTGGRVPSGGVSSGRVPSGRVLGGTRALNAVWHHVTITQSDTQDGRRKQCGVHIPVFCKTTKRVRAAKAANTSALGQMTIASTEITSKQTLPH